VTQLLANIELKYPAFDFCVDLDLDLSVVTAIFGPSGSGKTTLLRCLAGLQRSHRARIILGNMVWQDTDRNIWIPVHKRALGYVFQDARLFPHLSVRANLRYGLRRTPLPMRKVSWDQVIDVLGLGPLLDRRPDGLSGGERQRVAIGRAALSGPALLLLDEPLASLDAGAKKEILPFLDRMNAVLKIPMLYVTHSLDEVSRLAATLVLLDRGRVLAVGPIDRVTSRIDIPEYTRDLDAGSILRAQVLEPDAGDGLTRLKCGNGALLISKLDAIVGAWVHIHIRARDVALSLSAPMETSVLNVLAGNVVQISAGAGPQAHVLLDVGERLWARVMRKSVHDLRLQEGMPVYALIKAVAVDNLNLASASETDDCERR
jgi:molybdate transport system ATP-binding protein